MRSMSRIKIFRVTFRVRHVRPLTTSPVLLPVVAFTEMISSGSHDGGQVLQGESPTVNEPVCVDTGKEASEILVVDARCREGVEVGVLEELDEVENVTFCEVVREGLWT